MVFKPWNWMRSRGSELPNVTQSQGKNRPESYAKQIIYVGRKALVPELGSSVTFTRQIQFSSDISKGFSKESTYMYRQERWHVSRDRQEQIPMDETWQSQITARCRPASALQISGTLRSYQEQHPSSGKLGRSMRWIAEFIQSVFHLTILNKHVCFQ